MTQSGPARAPLRSRLGAAIEIVPGLALSAIVAVAAHEVAPLLPRMLPLPAMVLALFIGMMFHPIAKRPAIERGMTFCVKTLLRWAVALLGIRIGLADIAALGSPTAALVVASMVATIASGFVFATLNGLRAEFGALVGAATAVCGASAALATSTVVPYYPGKQADIVFVVVGVNALATLALLVFPPLCALLGFDPRDTGVMLGGTIHDVAQVVGAGYAVSEPVGNAAVIVKLFRVFLLLPVVLGIGWYFTSRGAEHGEAKVPLPIFAFVFLLLCVVNSTVPLWPTLAPLYVPARALLIEVSTWGLLVAIGALGLGTSVSGIAALGWRHAITIVGTTLVIVVIVIGGLLALRPL